MLTNFLINTGFTRDSATWFWSKLVSGCALLASGVLPLADYGINAKWQHIITITCAIVLWFAGSYSSSPLPGAPKK